MAEEGEEAEEEEHAETAVDPRPADRTPQAASRPSARGAGTDAATREEARREGAARAPHKARGERSAGEGPATAWRGTPARWLSPTTRVMLAAPHAAHRTTYAERSSGTGLSESLQMQTKRPTRKNRDTRARTRDSHAEGTWPAGDSVRPPRPASARAPARARLSPGLPPSPASSRIPPFVRLLTLPLDCAPRALCLCDRRVGSTRRSPIKTPRVRLFARRRRSLAFARAPRAAPRSRARAPPRSAAGERTLRVAEFVAELRGPDLRRNGPVDARVR